MYWLLEIKFFWIQLISLGTRNIRPYLQCVCIMGGKIMYLSKKVNALNVLAVLRGKFLVFLQGIKIEDAKEFFLELEKHSENKNTQFNNTAW